MFRGRSFTLRSSGAPGNVRFREHAPGVRRIAGIVLAVLLIGGVVAAVVAGRDNEETGTATKTVRMVIGSEKAEFFADPDVVKALAAKGYTVKAETSGSWAMEGLDLKGFDLAFPSSQAPAAELAAKYKVTGTLPARSTRPSSSWPTAGPPRCSPGTGSPRSTGRAAAPWTWPPTWTRPETTAPGSSSRAPRCTGS